MACLCSVLEGRAGGDIVVYLPLSSLYFRMVGGALCVYVPYMSEGRSVGDMMIHTSLSSSPCTVLPGLDLI